MNYKKRNNKKLYLVLGFVVFLVIVLGSTNFVFNYYLKTPSIIKDNPINTSKIYSNDIDGLSFEYPNSFKIEETIRYGNSMISLEKDMQRDDEGYVLEKGAAITLVYMKNVPLSNKYVKELNSFWFDSPVNDKDGTIEEKMVNNNVAFEVEYGHDNPLNVPEVIRFYIKNGNDALELSFIFGSNSTKDEYTAYLKEYNSIVNSVKFMK